MFTGIITNLGKLVQIIKSDNNDLELIIAISKSDINRNLEIGCSISCNGICLTLIEKINFDQNIQLKFQASRETNNKTTISNWKIDQLINIEFSLRVGDELGGHMVLGHIDQTTKITNIIKSDDSWIFSFSLPHDLYKHISKKGSITINGVSLTINSVDDHEFSVNIIPHTYNNTNFKNLAINDIVNIEIDTISRYIAKLISTK